jgi:LysM repeat protein
MAERRRPTERSTRLRGARPTTHTTRHPVYGGQARRDRQTGPYIIGFVLVVVAIAAFLYVGLNWATGQSRIATLAAPPTNTPIRVVVPVPSPSPSPAEQQTYIVQAGDNPATIAQKFRVKTEDLMAANNIEDPSKLQIGQTLKIPTSSNP